MVALAAPPYVVADMLCCLGLGFFLAMNLWVGESIRVQVWSLLLLTLTQIGTVLLCGRAMAAAPKDRQGAV